MGKPLVQFADFVAATDSRWLTGPEEIHNDATKRTYGFMSDMMLGRGVEETVRGGQSIKETVQLKAGTQFGFYQPGQTLTPSNEDSTTTLEYQWRFAKNSWGWIDQEIMLNAGESEEICYKRLKKIKEQAAITNTYNGMEEAFISQAPTAALMEGTGAAAVQPFSLRAFITEAGGAPTTTDGAPVNWTTLAGVNPTTETKWVNQVANYTTNSISTTLLKSFRSMWRKLKFKKPRTREDFFKDTNFRKTRILTDAVGQEKYEQILTEGNDSFRPSNDAGANSEEPMFRGLPVEYIEELDTVATAMGWGNNPRYFFPNFEYMFPVFHAGRYMERMNPTQLTQVGQPESWVVYVLIWYQIVCRSRYRQGIVCPA